MALSNIERQKKFVLDQKKEGLIRVSFYVDRKEWERFKKSKQDLSWSDYVRALYRFMVKHKFSTK